MEWLAPMLALMGHAPVADPKVETPPGTFTLPVFFGTLFGAFAGFLVGLILARLIGFVAYLAGREYEGRGLIVFTTLAGAACGAWMVLTR